MQTYESLKHTTWECKYHIVFIPKCRRESLYGHIRRELGEVFRRLAEQKESKVEEGHLMPDHVHNVSSLSSVNIYVRLRGYFRPLFARAISANRKKIPAEPTLCQSPELLHELELAPVEGASR